MSPGGIHLSAKGVAMLNANWKKWACAAIVSAALLPAAGFARAAHRTAVNKQALAVNTTTESKNDKKKLTHRAAPAKKLVRKAAPAKNLVSKTHSAKKLTSKK